LRAIIAPYVSQSISKSRVVSSERPATITHKSGQPVRLIVIDTLARAMQGADENSNLDMGTFVAKCAVHHTGKDAARGARGHNSLLAAVDSEIEVERKNGERLWRLTKCRDGSDGTETGFRLTAVELGSDEDSDPITSCVVEPAEIGPAATKPEKKQKWQLALDVLRNTSADHPEEPPDRVKYPSTTLTRLETLPARAGRDVGNSRHR
jgi:hypothetical protein